jgi:putative tryptophan/tyrosine transport system substrate-binding protein
MAIRIRRREFIATLGGAATWPFVARAQQQSDLRTVAVIVSVAEGDNESKPRIAAFRAGFEELWKEHEKIRFEYRWTAGRVELAEQYAREIVALAPAVIVANGTPVIAALLKLTSSIPIVCAMVNDPVSLGFVKSLSQPGGNVTGFTFINSELIGKWMNLLKDSDPSLIRAALLFNPNTAPFYANFLREIEAAHWPGPLALAAMPVAGPEEMEKAIIEFGSTPRGGLIIGPDSFTVTNIERIAQLAAGNRLRAVSVYRPFAAAGGLMSYGPDTADIFRRTADYVARILKGASPADLPVQHPTKFDFVINVKAATALGLMMPPTLLALADEVIE